MDVNAQEAYTKKMIIWLDNTPIVRGFRRVLDLPWIDILDQVPFGSHFSFSESDNLASHTSDDNYRLCREFRSTLKISNHHSPGGCTDILAFCDQDLVQIMKNGTKAQYRESRAHNPNLWRKTPAEGGHTEADRRQRYLEWVSVSHSNLHENHRSLI